MNFCFLRVLLIMASAVSVAWSWGEMGHRVVAKAAIPLLSNEAKGEVARLLGAGEDLIAASTWADEVRGGRQETRAWHYITLQVRGPQPQLLQADTPNVWSALMAAHNALIQPPGKADAIKVEALRWMVHLLADAHQPLHTGEDRDKGGNQTWIRLGRRKVNWHSAWDSGILEKKGWSEATLAAKVEEEIRNLKSTHPDSVQAIAEADFESVILESHSLARKAYQGSSTPIRGRGRALALEEVDLSWADSVSRWQLSRASIRLAYTLNRAFSANPPPGFHARPFQKRIQTEINPKLPEYGKGMRSSKHFVWSKNSKVYHKHNCSEASRITPKNFQTANSPPSGMKLHQGCPK
jgi:hypothetical protein